MDKQIRERIKLIQQGQIPVGYKKSEFGIFPCDWITDKAFSELFVFYNGLGKSREELSTEGVEYLHYGDMHRSDYNIIYYDQYSSLPKYNIMLKGNETYLMKDGDIAFLDASEDLEGTSRSVLIVNPENRPFIAGLHIIFAESRGAEFFKYYKQYLTIPEYIQKQFRRLAVGFKVYGINKETLPKIKCAFPCNVCEQKRISEILMKWDKAVELQKKLVEKLKLSKTLKVRMIIKNVSEQSKFTPLSEYLTPRNEMQTPSSDAPLMAFIANIGISEKGKRFDRSPLIKNKDKEYKRTELNDFIYSSNNLDVGSIGLNKYGTAVISDVYEIFKTKSNVIPSFINEVIQLPENIYKILKYRQGALYGQYRIHPDDFLKVEVKVPTIEEQKTISSIILCFEKSIELESKKLEKLHLQRKIIQRFLLNGIIRV